MDFKWHIETAWKLTFSNIVPLILMTLVMTLVSGFSFGFVVLFLPGFLMVVAMAFCCLYMLPLMTDKGLAVVAFAVQVSGFAAFQALSSSSMSISRSFFISSSRLALCCWYMEKYLSSSWRFIR